MEESGWVLLVLRKIVMAPSVPSAAMETVVVTQNTIVAAGTRVSVKAMSNDPGVSAVILKNCWQKRELRDM